jgi:signal transduction histidine kinase
VEDWVSKSYCLNNIGLIYFESEDYITALDYFNQSLVLRRNAGDKWGEAGCLDNIGLCYFKTIQLDAAIDYRQSLEIAKAIRDSKGQGNSLMNIGNIYRKKNSFDEALNYYRQSLTLRKKIGDKKGEAEVIVLMSEIYTEEDKDLSDEAFDLLKEALNIGNDIKSNDLLSKIHYAFYKVNKKKDLFADALFHLETYYKIEREIHKSVLNQKILNLEISHRVEQTKQEAEIFKLRNVELANLYEEIKTQKADLESTLSELKSTQAQLIQSEKMASLGELTAGIAHEIQNPLNFVNNFSDVNKEMLVELKAERLKPKAERDEKNEDEIINDVIANEEKINHHGKRADAIVKGMLQHSRTSTGAKEPTDINALCDEYLRLSYHGLRAKDKDFNAIIKTDFDNSIGKINVIPQDIGRVLLNLFNNAFYAVNEKKNASTSSKGQPYEPTVTVSTKTVKPPSGGLGVLITVSDNGNGIPQKIVDKIFQPFFTTKPTGQGTGLGLSLSYDIVKAHGGEIKVESTGGNGTVFLIK